jgi:hypothetical protein
MEDEYMNSYMRNVLPVYVFILLVAAVLLIPSLNYSASAQQCTLIFCKSAPELPVPQSEEELVFFPFTAIFETETESFELAANAKCTVGGIDNGARIEIVEDFFPGWLLSDVECSDAVGVNVTPIEHGVALDCIQPSEITCTFTNVRGSISNIPTLSEWGMIAAAGGLALIGVFFAVRRRAKAA